MRIAKVDFINYWKHFPKSFVPFEIATFRVTGPKTDMSKRLIYFIVMNIGICIRYQLKKETNKNK